MKQSIYTPNAPKAIGTYSQAIACNGFLFLSGQIPLDPATLELVKGDIKTQTKQIFSNIQAILTQTSVTLDNLVKLTIYLTDLGHFALLNETMQSLLNEPYPARAVVEVKALPKGALIEIEAVAAL